MAAASAREIARRVLARVEREQAFASLALGGELARAKLPPPERRLATELCYGVLRHRSRLDRALSAYARRGLGKTPPAVLTALRVGAYQILFLDRVPAHAAVSDAVDAARRAAGPKLAGFANGLLRRLAREGEPPLPQDGRERVLVETSTPAWLAAAVDARLPEGERAEALRALAEPAPLWLRARGDAAELAATLAGEGQGAVAEPTTLCPGAVAVRGLGSPEHSAAFRAGAFAVQDFGAQLVGHLVGPERRSVLDACAGVGGKSAHLADRLGDEARIDAADLSATKLELCAATAERLGITTIRPVRADLTDPAAPLAPSYDAVVLDAPCSGLGVVRRHPERKWREPDVAGLAALQRRLLAALAPRVRPGGELVYSVCTFTAAEGPEQVEAFLAAHPEFARAEPPPGPPWSELTDAHGALVTWPHRCGADGFYAARLVRRG